MGVYRVRGRYSYVICHMTLPLILMILWCLGGLMSVNAAQVVTREQVLFAGQNMDIPFLGFGNLGPYSIEAGKTIRVEWVADRQVWVYILNEVDWRSWSRIVQPLVYRVYKIAQEGSLEFAVKYPDRFYVVVTGPYLNAARLYKWIVKVTWEEVLAGNLTVTVYDDNRNLVDSALVNIVGPERHSRYTDIFGRAIFTDLAPGEYTITVTKSGYQMNSSRANVEHGKNSIAEITITQVKIQTAEKVTTVTVIVTQTGALGTGFVDSPLNMLYIALVIALIAIAITLYIVRRKKQIA